MRTLFVILTMFMVGMAYAQSPQPQQQQQQVSPSEFAITITTSINSMASALEQATRQIKTLTEQNATLQKQLDELKEKHK